MSRLTGSDALGLYEAYQAVYNPQELTEEQVWEEVETWVNDLIEEGYDLSEYTWEEMYDAYLDEGRGSPGAAEAQQRTLAQNAARVNSGGTLGAGGGQAAMKALQAKGVSSRSAYATVYSQGEKNIQQAGRQPAQSTGMYGRYAAPSQQVKTPAPARPATTPTKPATTATRPAASTPARPGTPAASVPRPAASSPAPKPAAATTPTAPKPATGMLGKTSFERRTPTSAELKAAQASRAGGEKNPEKVLQAAKAASTPKPAATPATGNTLSQTTAAASKPAAFSPTPAATPAAKPPLKKPIVAGFDMFDVVKGYLIGEGYADTEEAALAIMINMSEEWRQSIVEERAPGVKPYEPRKRRPLDPEKAPSGEMGDGSGYGADEKFKKPDDKIKKPGTEVPAPKKGGYGRIFSNIPYGIGAHANRNRSRNSTIRGMDPGAPRSEKLAPTEKKEKKKTSTEIVRKRKDTNESYNIILSYLLDEGYANTVESAEAIISNMSEDWILSIIQ